MGEVRTEITLKNGTDVELAALGQIKEDEIRRMTVHAVVDTGAMHMVIDEETCQKLGLRDMGDWQADFANGYKELCKMAGPLEVWWKDRRAHCEAIVLPGAPDILLGAVPMELMDLSVNPSLRQLVGNHGDTLACRV